MSPLAADAYAAWVAAYMVTTGCLDETRRDIAWEAAARAMRKAVAAEVRAARVAHETVTCGGHVVDDIAARIEDPKAYEARQALARETPPPF